MKHQGEHINPLKSLQCMFTAHPHEAGESYFAHLCFTVKTGLRFAGVSSIIILHGIFPFLFTKTASTKVEALYRDMKSRIPMWRVEEMGREKLYSRKPHVGIAGDARIAIVGGGFSGVAVLANLVKRATRPFTIEWLDAGEIAGVGVAYSTRQNRHLLNVRAIRMGLYADRPQGFWEWLSTEAGRDAAARIWPGGVVSENAYVPRMLYGEYLRQIVEECRAEAKKKGIQINLAKGRVKDAALANDSQQLTLFIDYGITRREALVDALVLATGNLPPRRFNFLSGIAGYGTTYLPDAWRSTEKPDFAARIKALPEDAEIVIFGSGLTMVDMLLTLEAKGYKGKITVLSRGGAIPAVHKHCDAYPAWGWVTDPRKAPNTALGLLRGLRKEVKRAAANGYDWRPVIDSLRPVTQALWKNLNIEQRRRFINRLLTLWNVHRHRMAPEIFTELDAMRRSGRLKIVSGTIYHAGGDKDAITISYRRRGASEVETIRPALVLNCTGPEYDIAASDHPLLINLRDRGLITVGPLRVGIEVTSTGSAKGCAPDALFPVGPMLAGEYLECTAVPELREVASNTADNVLKRVAMISHEDVAEGLSLGEWI